MNISHYLNTLQLKTRLKAIYRDYYQGQERQFIDLLELVSAYSLPKVSQTITMLGKIPTTVNSEKIRLILERYLFGF